MTAIDPITFSVILNRLSSIATEMTLALEKAAFTAILSLARDYSCCIYDARARQVAVVDAIPIHTNSVHLVLAAIVEAFDGDIHEGDVIACNDPYRGNTHIGDLVTAVPVFHESRLMFWSVAKGHQLDVGAPVPTSAYAGARNVWQEGLTIPPLKLYERGRPRKDVIDLYLSNLRWRALLEGDLMAQLGAAWTGERRLHELCAAYGRAALELYLEEAIRYAERRTRAEIREWPNGTYSAEGWLDSDGGAQRNVPIRCTVAIEDEAIHVDFSGSAQQVDGGMNASYAVLQAAGGIPVVMAIDPDIPHNEGCLRTVTVTAPEGSICNARYPAATAVSTVEPGDLMQDVVCMALAQAVPERIRAGNTHWQNIPMLSGVDERTGVFWGYLLVNGGGGGGAAHGVDGWPLLTCNAAQGGLKTASVEHTELLHPLMIEEWEVEPGSMGLGAWIGGPGIRCTLRPLHGAADALFYSDALINPPYGLAGGTPGAGGGSYIEDDATGVRRFLPPAVYARIGTAERWTGVSTGGGGFGNPLERAAEQVRLDVRDGLYSAALAAEVYGVVLAGSADPEIDEQATGAARLAIAARQADEGVPLVLPRAPATSTWVERTMRPADQLLARTAQEEYL